MNYTKIRVVFKDWSTLYISEEEVDVFTLSRDYRYIEYLNDKGQLHRLDGPTREFSDGVKSWWVNGQLHRADGPAIEWASGIKWWFVNGQAYSKEEFEKEFG